MIMHSSIHSFMITLNSYSTSSVALEISLTLPPGASPRSTGLPDKSPSGSSTITQTHTRPLTSSDNNWNDNP